MHNSNGKKVIENVILVSLGKCKPVSMVYSNIMKCANKYFQVDVTTHIRSQPNSDPTMNRYTGDVVVMGLMTDNVDDAVEWMLEDCPKTPKIVIADAEASSDPAQIRRKIHQMEAAMLAYSIGQPQLVYIALARLGTDTSYAGLSTAS